MSELFEEITRSISRGSMDSASLSEKLNHDTQELKTRDPRSMSAIERMLDTHGDGDVDMEDIASSGLPKILGKFLK